MCINVKIGAQCREPRWCNSQHVAGKQEVRGSIPGWGTTEFVCQSLFVYIHSKMPILRPPFELPKSGLIREVVLILNIISYERTIWDWVRPVLIVKWS